VVVQIEEGRHAGWCSPQGAVAVAAMLRRGLREVLRRGCPGQPVAETLSTRGRGGKHQRASIWRESRGGVKGEGGGRAASLPRR
jgi:hypothetical protein